MKHSNISYKVSMPMQLMIRITSVQRKKEENEFSVTPHTCEGDTFEIHIRIYP